MGTNYIYIPGKGTVVNNITVAPPFSNKTDFVSAGAKQEVVFDVRPSEPAPVTEPVVEQEPEVLVTEQPQDETIASPEDGPMVVEAEQPVVTKRGRKSSETNS